MRVPRPLLAVLLASVGLLLASPTLASTPSAAIQKLLGLSKPPAATPYLYVERNGNGVRGVIAQVVPLSAEHVMTEILMCYGAFPEWFPLQKDARYVTEVADQRTTIYGKLEFPWPIGPKEFEANIHGWVDTSKSPEVYRIDFTHKKGTGNMRNMEGSWKVQPYAENQALVVYDSTADFDTWVPGFLLARGTKQFLPAITQRMKARTGKCADEDKPVGTIVLPE